MEHPLIIRSPHIALDEAQQNLIEQLAAKLERYYPHMVRCEVSIEPPPQHHRKGKPYEVRIEIGVPGPDLHVREDNETTLDSSVRAAFEKASRQLEDYAQLRRREVKRHEPGPREVQA